MQATNWCPQSLWIMKGESNGAPNLGGVGDRHSRSLPPTSPTSESSTHSTFYRPLEQRTEFQNDLNLRPHSTMITGLRTSYRLWGGKKIIQKCQLRNKTQDNWPQVMRRFPLWILIDSFLKLPGWWENDLYISASTVTAVRAEIALIRFPWEKVKINAWVWCF